ncbi:MAG: hypothetical protein ABFD04_02120 [Syntrophomonas sp.]
MKKLSLRMSIACLIIACLALPVSASSPLTVKVNGVVADAPAEMNIVEGQVMVPLYWAVQQLGVGSVGWDAGTGAITIKTSQDYYSIEKLDSYLNGLKEENLINREIWPLPDKIKSLKLPPARNQQWILNLERDKHERKSLSDPLLDLDSIDVIVTDEAGSYEHRSNVHSFENHEGHYYLPMDWLEYLFKATVDYDQAANILSIQAAAPEQAKTEITKIENALIPASPEEAVKLWGRGEQLRCGALQYAALSPELREKAANSSAARQTYWVTGCSSPWVGPISIDKQTKITDTRVEYAISYPECTSSLPYTTATEKIIVEKLKGNGNEGWFITQVIQSTPYGIIDETNDSYDIRGCYEFEENVYTNPLSSFLAVKGHMPYYKISARALTINNDENGSKQEYSADFSKVPLNKERFTSLFNPDLGRPDISRYRECYQYAVFSAQGTPQYRLYVMDNEVWLAAMHNDVMWSIYRLKKTDEK